MKTDLTNKMVPKGSTIVLVTSFGRYLCYLGESFSRGYIAGTIRINGAYGYRADGPLAENPLTYLQPSAILAVEFSN